MQQVHFNSLDTGDTYRIFLAHEDTGSATDRSCVCSGATQSGINRHKFQSHTVMTKYLGDGFTQHLIDNAGGWAMFTSPRCPAFGTNKPGLAAVYDNEC